MYFYSSKAVANRILIAALLVVLLTGCVNNTSSQSSTRTTPIAKTPTATTGSPLIPSGISLNQNTSFNLSSVNIQADASACPFDDWLYDYDIKYSGGNVILINNNTSYDAGAIANLAASIDKGDPSLLPNGFAAALGTLYTPTNPNACYSDWEITNTSQETIQVTQIALLYTADPRPNTYHYKLVDICSLPIQTKSKICYGGRGAHSDAQIYTFQLGTGSSGTIVSSQEPKSFSIAPGATVPVQLVMIPKDTSNPNFIYSIVPQLTLSTSPQPQELSQLASKVVFTDSSLTSCYQLQHDNTFVQMNNPSIPYGQGVPDGQGNVVFPECI